MIIIETTYFILITLFSIFSIYGLGQLLVYKFNKNFFESTFYGFIVISFLITVFHFFIKINLYFSFIIFFLGFIVGIKKFNFLKIKLDKKTIIYSLIFLTLVPIYISQKYHEDFGYYHLPYLINMINEKIIFGLANVNYAFAHNSIWLNILSVFYLRDNFNFVSLPTFIIYNLFIIFSISQIIKNNYKISNYFLIVSIFYLILKYTRISEFGNDIPSIIFSILSIYNFFLFNEEKGIKRKKNFFFNNFSFACFAILIKFSSIPILMLTFILFFKNYKILIKDILKFNYIFIYSLCFFFFLQQFFYTGCFIFPSNFSCFNVSWFNEYFLDIKYKLELINKSYFVTAKDSLSEEEYLKNFTWLSYWFKKNYIEISEHLLTMSIPLLAYLIFLKKTNSKNILYFKEFRFFIFFTLIGLIFWLSFSPVYRFGVIYFLCLIFLLTFLISKKKFFSQKIFIIFLSIFLIFNLSKNIKRLVKEEKIFFGIKKIENDHVINSYNNNIISVYRPDFEANLKKGNGWQSRLCWDIKFLCTRNEILINRKNKYLIIKDQKKK